MATYYYICPYETMYAIGGGQFVVAPPDSQPGETIYTLGADGELITAREVRAARVMLYGTWDQAWGTRCSAIKGVGANGLGKSWCVARVQEERPKLGLIDWDALNADKECKRLAIPANLDAGLDTLTKEQRDQLVSQLEAMRVPADDLGDKTGRNVVRRVACVLLAAQELETDYPETDLANTWATIATAQKQTLAAWAESKEVDLGTISSQTTIRAVVKTIASARREPVRIGGEEF